MNDVKAFPTTEEELLELGPGPHFFPATFEEFLDFTPKTDLRTEFVNEQIVLRSYASLLHEMIVMQIGALLLRLHSKEYQIIGSSHRVFRETMVKSFAPDLFVIKGKAQSIKPAGKVSMITNPWLVVEVLSPSTNAYDLGTKLLAYQLFPSVQYVLYVHTEAPKATLYTRIDGELWRSEDYNARSKPLQIADLTIPLGEVYRNLPGEEE